jgi:hemerythrin superfamily protein
MEAKMPTGASTSTGSKKSSSSKSAASKSKSTAKKPTSARSQDAIALLKADHRAVEKLFAAFEKAKDDERKKQLADQICMELRVHAQLEEELVYPVSREFLKEEDLVDEAVVEHQAAKDLIEQIEGMQPDEDLFDAKVSVLKEQIEHHVEEEEKEYFPQIQKTEMDLKAIGEQIKARKKELMAQMGGDQGRATH